MNFRPKSRSHKGKRFFKETISVFLVLGAGVLVFTLLRPVLMPVAAQLWQADSALGQALGSVSSGFRSKENLREENIRLREAIYSLEIQSKVYKEFEAREQELLALLERSEESGAVVARVLARPPQTPYDSVIIDAGSKQGLREGMNVLLPEGPLLGEVVELYASQAKVELYSSSGKSMSAVLGVDGPTVSLEGRGGGNFHLTLPREAEVEIGDLVYSSGIEARLLAEVVDVAMNPTDSFKQVKLVGPANIFDVKSVIILP